LRPIRSTTAGTRGGSFALKPETHRGWRTLQHSPYSTQASRTSGAAPVSVFACAVRPLPIMVLTSAETKPAPPAHSRLRLDRDEGLVMQLQEPNSISASSCRIEKQSRLRTTARRTHVDVGHATLTHSRGAAKAYVMSERTATARRRGGRVSGRGPEGTFHLHLPMSAHWARPDVPRTCPYRRV